MFLIFYYTFIMKVHVFEDTESLSEFASNELFELLRHKPGAVICLASGDSLKRTCELFVQKVRGEKINLSEFTFIGLDEWVGIAPNIKGSCRNDFEKRIFEPISLSPAQYHLFDALSDNPEKECRDMDNYIKEKGGIDLMIVGIGMNGHIGFNEPGTDHTLLSHVVGLDETTVSIGQKYFTQAVSLKKGITLGLAYLMGSKKVFLLAHGIKKSGVIKKAVEGAVSNSFPASIMQHHKNGFILVDKEAGSLLAKKIIQQ